MKTADTINIEHTCNATIKQVWNAWTQPALILQWFGSDPNGKGICASLDVEPGGPFEITFQNSDGEEFTCSGIYKQVEPFSKLTFTWSWKNEPGVESFVTVLLSSVQQQKTLMKFEHAHVGFASAHNYLKGWNDAFLKLDRVLLQ